MKKRIGTDNPFMEPTEFKGRSIKSIFPEIRNSLQDHDDKIISEFKDRLIAEIEKSENMTGATKHTVKKLIQTTK